MTFLKTTESNIFGKTRETIRERNGKEPMSKESAIHYFFRFELKEEIDTFPIEVLGKHEDYLYFKVKDEDGLFKTQKYESYIDFKESKYTVYSVEAEREHNYKPRKDGTKYSELVKGNHSTLTVNYHLDNPFKDDQEVEEYLKDFTERTVLLDNLEITDKDNDKIFKPTKEEYESAIKWSDIYSYEVYTYPKK